jgi:hypothetical protein
VANSEIDPRCVSGNRRVLKLIQCGRHRLGGQLPGSVQSPDRGQDLGIEMGGSMQLVTAHSGSHRATEV